jgi:uncharacterized protein YggE
MMPMIFRFLTRSITPMLAMLLALGIVQSAHGDSPSGITVTGSGTVKSKPTEVEIGAMVSGEAEITNDAMVKYRDAKKRALAAIEGLKLPNLAVESNGVSVSQALDPNAQQMMMQGRAGNVGKPKVQTSESLKITIKSIDANATDKLMDTVMKVIDTGRDAGLQIGPPVPTNYYQMQQMMNSGQGQTMLQFKIGDPSAQKDKAYKMAMDDAKAKAQRLAELAGVKLGKIISVQDSVPVKSDNSNMMAMMYGYGGGVQTDPSDLTSQMLADISLKVTLTVQFEIAK